MKKFKSLIVILTIMLVALTAIMPTMSFAAEEEETETYTITIVDSEGNPVTGRTFEAYKLFNLSVSSDGSSYAYTMTDNLKAYFTGNSITINSDQEAVEYINNLDADGLDAFAASYYAYCQTNNVTADASSESNVITVDSKGYYLIYDTTTTIAEGETRSALMITTVGVTEPTTEITIKTTTVDVDKTVDNTSATIGDDVTFTITSHVPDTSKYDTYEFIITDTVSSGLDIDTTSIEVKIGETTIESSNYTVSAVTTNEDGTKTFTIEFTDAKTLFETYSVGDAITVTYIAEVTAAGEQSNSAKIEYSNDPVDGRTGETGEDIVYVYSYTVQLTKLSSAGKVLSGAKFELKDSEGKVVATAISDENGLVTFTGLAAGTYTLTETEAPDGYYLPTTSFNFTITENLDDSGKLQTASVSWATDSDANYVTYGTASSITTGSSITAANSALTLVVYNYTTNELPSTGGIGTTIFTIVGIAVMAIAVIALVVRNRRSKRV